jgi:hypothetical protein
LTTDVRLDLSISSLLYSDEGEYRYQRLTTDARLDLSISSLLYSDGGEYSY